MKYFQSAQKLLAIVGISPTRKPFNQRALMVSLLYALNSVLICAYFGWEANSFREYVDATYASTASISMNIYFAIMVYQKENIFNLIETMDEIAERSESYSCLNYIQKADSESKNTLGSKRLASKAMYDETNRQIEKWTKIIDVVVVKVTSRFAIIPQIVLCYFLYFTTDLGNDAFELPFAIWYGLKVDSGHIILTNSRAQASCLRIFN